MAALSAGQHARLRRLLDQESAVFEDILLSSVDRFLDWLHDREPELWREVQEPVRSAWPSIRETFR
ncbi:hypothetical protein Q0Z83_022150 [Actinoplanes sichuanensis]|uniref:Uncharacterized protein n=1 Tax=Actinoplanes sichuanensis TaxID=512349 RepID=A0ABW4AI51_9ACTN|nr:hypothetical protein [Actinoplanes sichuanensis]BEL04024.1 hypothetical protein Q0Z83_022150 [Actinoplanes sichuanensis]